MVPLFVPGAPGGPELLILLFLLLFFVTSVVVIALAVWLLGRDRDSGDGRRSASDADAVLERQVVALEERVERLESAGDDH